MVLLFEVLHSVHYQTLLAPHQLLLDLALDLGVALGTVSFYPEISAQLYLQQLSSDHDIFGQVAVEQGLFAAETGKNLPYALLLASAAISIRIAPAQLYAGLC